MAVNASWGDVQVGRLVLRETYDASSRFNQNTGGRSVSLAGQESLPPLTVAQLQAKREDLVGLTGTLVPVSFTNKSDHDGYYMVVDAQADISHWTRAGDPGGRQGAGLSWQLVLDYVGPANAVDLESRLDSPGRQNDFAQIGERWHAPSAGAYGYTVGAAGVSGSVSRTSADGSLTAYRGVPAAVAPRWAASLANYAGGRTRVTLGAIERSGVNLTVAGSGGWTLENALVRVSAAPQASINVSVFGSGGWTAGKDWNICRGGSGAAAALSPVEAVTVIRNDYEASTVRLLYTFVTGRTLVDLTLRRGSRFVEGYEQTDASTTLAVSLDTAENGTAPASGGYVTATANDTDGNRYIVGTARSFTALTGQGGIQKSAAIALDFYIGAVINGASAVSGDQAANLQAQYIGVMAESTTGVRR
jgi:hypothetical protein